METFYYNLSGGINQSSTKTNVGLDTKNIYWADAQNVEIYQNRGIIRQKGNIKLAQLPTSEKITCLHEIKKGDTYKLLISTTSGKLYIYNGVSFQLLSKTITSQTPTMVSFLNGVIVSSKTDKMFYINNDASYTVEDCNFKSGSTYLYSDTVGIYKGRVWASVGSTLYFSALGKYNDFETSNDAGYIADFYTDTDDIVAVKTYKDYLAIYKENSVYLLSGSSPTDFSIEPFANKGAYSQKGIVDVENKQYFFSNAIYKLEVGDLNQIVLGSQISEKIKNEFQKFDFSRLNEVIALNYETKNQIWYFIPYSDDVYFHTIWINDVTNKAWYKRVLPFNITASCLYDKSIVTADNLGNIYKEDIGKSFNGSPISFMWKSPFLALGNPTIRKTIDEFYFLLDEAYENNFKFSIFKNYDSENQDDKEDIYSTNTDNLVWSKDNSVYELNDKWAGDGEDGAIWAVNTESMYKAEISEANYSVQLCVEGNQLEHSMAIIGLEFKEIYKED